jgi:hypothetical protein
MPKALNADRELVKSLFVQGFTPTQIARKMGLNADTVSTWSKRGSWTALRSKTYDSLNQPLENLAAMTIAEHSARVRDSLAQDLHATADTLRQTPVETDLEHLGRRAEVNQKLAASAGKVFEWGESQNSGSFQPGDMARMDAIMAIEVETTTAPVKQLT